MNNDLPPGAFSHSLSHRPPVAWIPGRALSGPDLARIYHKGSTAMLSSLGNCEPRKETKAERPPTP